MKITVNQLRRIIKEEAGKVLSEGDPAHSQPEFTKEDMALKTFERVYQIPTTNLSVEKGRIMVRVGNRIIPSMLVAEVLESVQTSVDP